MLLRHDHSGSKCERADCCVLAFVRFESEVVQLFELILFLSNLLFDVPIYFRSAPSLPSLFVKRNRRSNLVLLPHRLTSIGNVFQDTQRDGHDASVSAAERAMTMLWDREATEIPVSAADRAEHERGYSTNVQQTNVTGAMNCRDNAPT